MGYVYFITTDSMEAKKTTGETLKNALWLQHRMDMPDAGKEQAEKAVSMLAGMLMQDGFPLDEINGTQALRISMMDRQALSECRKNWFRPCLGRFKETAIAADAETFSSFSPETESLRTCSAGESGDKVLFELEDGTLLYLGLCQFLRGMQPLQDYYIGTAVLATA